MFKLWLMAVAVTRRHQLRWSKHVLKKSWLVWHEIWYKMVQLVKHLKAMQFLTCCGSKRVSAHYTGVHSSKWPYICIKFDPLPKNGWHLKMTPEKKKHIHHNFSRQDPTEKTNHQHRTTAPQKTPPCYTAWTPDPVIFMALYIGSFRNFEISWSYFYPTYITWWSGAHRRWVAEVSTRKWPGTSEEPSGLKG